MWWTEEEVEFLKENYKEMEDKELAKKLGRNTKTISWKRLSLGLRKRRAWTEEETRFLIDNWEDMSDEKLAIKLNRSKISVKQQRLKLKLNYFLIKKWVKKETEILIKLYPSRKNKEIAKVLNKTRIAVKEKAKRLGLRKPKKFFSEHSHELWENDGNFRRKALKALNENRERAIRTSTERIKRMNRDPNFQKKRIKGLLKRPTSLEGDFITFFQKYNLPFNYCGDGALIIGTWCPDFVGNNGGKSCIEVSNKTMRRKVAKEIPEEYARERIDYFAKYGWKCLVLWEEELKNEKKLLQKVQNFMNS